MTGADGAGAFVADETAWASKVACGRRPRFDVWESETGACLGVPIITEAGLQRLLGMGAA